MTKMNPSAMSSLDELLDYVWIDEERNYQESNKSRKHVFVHIRRLRQWIDAARKRKKKYTP